jgi:thiosulfate/3-mercaptopyruvate sulfurtransferase
MFRWIGHEAVWVLDGGLGAWKAFGGSLEKGLPDWTPADFSFHQAHHEWVVTAQEIPALLERGSVLLDARLEDRYHGVSEPIDHAAGHIPGAINYPFILNLKSNGQFYESSVLKEKFVRGLGGKNHDLIAMCGSGVTACQLLLALKIAGFADGRLFVGSWSEWIRDPNRPIKVGPDP